jgi:hypothetical protein
MLIRLLEDEHADRNAQKPPVSDNSRLVAKGRVIARVARNASTRPYAVRGDPCG